MNESVNKLTTVIEELKTKLTTLMIENGSIENITADDLLAIKMVFGLLNGIRDVVTEQSEIIERLSYKLDSIQKGI